MNQDKKDRTIIGQVVGVHGLNGELKINPLTDYPDRFLKMKQLSLFKGECFFRDLTVHRMRVLEGKSLFILDSNEISDADEAQSAVGCHVSVPSNERVPLPDDEYWIDDLIGMNVLENGQVIGTVKDVLRSGGNELYLIKGTDEKERMIPAVAEFIKNIDKSAKEITVSLIAGLWD